MEIFMLIFAVIVAVAWLLVIYSAVKFYREYKSNQLAFTRDSLDSTDTL